MSSPANSPVYGRFNRDLDMYRKGLKKMGVIPNFASEHTVARESVRHFYPADPGEIKNIALDLYWHEQGRKVLFPLPEVVDKLLEAQFQISSKEGLSWPYKSVIVSIPSNSNAAEIVSMRITFAESHDAYLKEILAPLVGDFDENRAKSYRDPSNEAWIFVEMQTLCDGEELSSTHTFPFSKLHEITSITVLEGVEGRALSMAVRLIGGIAVLNKITQGEVIQPGLPGNRFSGATHGHKHTKGDTLIMPDFGTDQNKKALHHRRWHLRTLTNPRYYQGEFKDAPIGSRVVFVKDALINKDLEADTFRCKADLSCRKKEGATTHFRPWRASSLVGSV